MTTKAVRPFLSRTQDPDRSIITWTDNSDYLSPNYCSGTPFCYVELYAQIYGEEEPLTVPIRITTDGTSQWSTFGSALVDDNAYYLIFERSDWPGATAIKFVKITPYGGVTQRTLLSGNPTQLWLFATRSVLLPDGNIAVVIYEQTSPSATTPPAISYLIVDTNGNIIRPKTVVISPQFSPDSVIHLIAVDTDPQGTLYIFYDNVRMFNQFVSKTYIAAIDPNGAVRYNINLFDLSPPQDMKFSDGRLHLTWTSGINSHVFYGQRNAADGQPINNIPDLQVDPSSDFSQYSSLTIDGSLVQMAYHTLINNQLPAREYLASFDKQRGTIVGQLTPIRTLRTPYEDSHHYADLFERGRLSFLASKDVNQWFGSGFTKLVEIRSIPEMSHRPLRRGGYNTISLSYPRRPGTTNNPVNVYFALIFNPLPGIPLPNGRTLPISPTDPLFIYSGALLQPQITQLDSNGETSTMLYIPESAPVGTNFFITAVVYDSSGIIDFNTELLVVPS